MSNRVFIGNVSYDMVSSELERALSNLGHGPKKVEIIIDRETGRSRGFAFAEYESDDAAERAIFSLNGEFINNRPIRVDRATSLRRPAGGPSHGGGAPGGGPPRHRDNSNGSRDDRGRRERGWDEEWSGGERRRGRQR